MKKLVALLLLSLVASVAFAGIDPDADSFGVYFDNGTWNQNSIAVQPAFVPFMAYLVLMNPASSTNGFECTVTPSGAPYFALSTTLAGSALDVDSSANGFAVGAAAPYAPVGGGLLLVSWQFMLQAQALLEFRISAATVPSLPGNLPVVTGDGQLRRCGVASGDVTLPVARCNGGAVVATENSSFGNVKSLFR